MAGCGRSKRTTAVLLGLAFAFILAAILLAVLPSQEEEHTEYASSHLEGKTTPKAENQATQSTTRTDLSKTTKNEYTSDFTEEPTKYVKITKENEYYETTITESLTSTTKITSKETEKILVPFPFSSTTTPRHKTTKDVFLNTVKASNSETTTTTTSMTPKSQVIENPGPSSTTSPKSSTTTENVTNETEEFIHLNTMSTTTTNSLEKSQAVNASTIDEHSTKPSPLPSTTKEPKSTTHFIPLTIRKESSKATTKHTDVQTTTSTTTTQKFLYLVPLTASSEASSKIPSTTKESHQTTQNSTTEDHDTTTDLPLTTSTFLQLIPLSSTSTRISTKSSTTQDDAAESSTPIGSTSTPLTKGTQKPSQPSTTTSEKTATADANSETTSHSTLPSTHPNPNTTETQNITYPLLFSTIPSSSTNGITEYPQNVTISTTSQVAEKLATNATTFVASSTPISDTSMEPETSPPHTEPRMPEFLETCQKPGCFNLASKMSHMIDHGQDKCKNFYDYFCGGAKLDDSFSATTVEEEIRNRLKAHIDVEEKNSTTSLFYHACLNQRHTLIQSEVLSSAKKVLQILNLKLNSASTELTEVIQFLIENKLNPFFEITFELSKKTELYIPVLKFNHFETHLTDSVEENICKEVIRDELNNPSFTGDFNDTYQNYAKCYTSPDKGLKKKLERIEDSCTLFFADSPMACQNAKEIYKEISQKYSSVIFESRKAIGSQESLDVAVDDLGLEFPSMLNLHSLLLKMFDTEPFKIRIYRKDKEITQILEYLGVKFESSPAKVKDFYRVFTGERLYSYLVNPLTSSSPEDYCLDIMQELLPKESLDLLQDSYTELEKEVAIDLFNRSMKLLPFQRDVKLQAEEDQIILPQVELSSFNHSDNVLKLLQRNQKMAFSFLHKNQSQISRFYVGNFNPSQYEVVFEDYKFPIATLTQPAMHFEDFPEYLGMAAAARILITPDLMILFSDHFLRVGSDEFGCHFPSWNVDEFTFNGTSSSGVEIEMKLPVDQTIMNGIKKEVSALEHIFMETFSDPNSGDFLPLKWYDSNKNILSPKEAFITFAAQTHCSSSSDLAEEIIALMEKGKLPSRFRLSVMSEVMSDEFSNILNCPRPDEKNLCSFVHERIPTQMAIKDY